MMNRRRLILSLPALGAGFGTGFCRPIEARADAKEPLQPSPPFALTAHDGRRIRTDRDFAGRPMLVYFGFTYCPDVCPSTLIRLSAAMNALEEKGHDLTDLAFLLVSVDPERDTPALLAEYVEAFHPSLIGATGAPEEIAKVAAGWRVKFGKAPGGSPDDYQVDHPGYALGLDRGHRVVSYLWHFAPEEKLEMKILELISH